MTPAWALPLGAKAMGGGEGMAPKRTEQDREVQPPNAARSVPSLQGLYDEDDVEEQNGRLLQLMYEQSGEPDRSR